MKAKPGKASKESQRMAAIAEALAKVHAGCRMNERREADPVGFVHRYSDPLDQEMAGLIAALLAFGNVKALRAKIADALVRLGDRPALAADQEEGVLSKLSGWKHRIYKDKDLAGLVIAARRLQKREGSLGHAFARSLQLKKNMRDALSHWTGEIRKQWPGPTGQRPNNANTRAALHLLPDPGKSSAVKRLMLYLRWMVRPADGIDLGLWPISPSLLLMPVDTHIHKLSLNLGFTQRKQADFRTVEEITAAMRTISPEDPVKFDFALCHLGMLQHCPSRKDEKQCEGCGIQNVCKYWG